MKVYRVLIEQMGSGIDRCQPSSTEFRQLTEPKQTFPFQSLFKGERHLLEMINRHYHQKLKLIIMSP